MALRYALDLVLRVLQPPETRGLRHFEHALSLFCSPLLARHAVALARALRRALQPAFDRALGRARGSAALALVALRRPKPRWLKATAALACAGAAGRYYQHKRSVSALVTRVRANYVRAAGTAFERAAHSQSRAPRPAPRASRCRT